MLKLLQGLFLSMLFLVVSANFAFGATLQLVSIGSVATGGMHYSEWWYTNENPTLSGTTDPSETVVVEIDTVADSAVADASGAWSYSPTALTNGDHDVVLSAGDQQYSFTIHIGSEVPTGTTTGATPSSTAAPSATTAPSGGTTTPSSLPDDLPVSGAIETTLVLLAGAGLLIFVGYKFVRA